MKKSLLLFTLVIMGTTLAAQIAFGPRVGYNMSFWPRYYDGFDKKEAGGIFGGLALTLEIRDKLINSYSRRNPVSLRSELYYQKSGMQYSHVSGNYSFDLSMDYVHLPLMLEYGFEAAQNLFLRVTGGCYTGVWASGKWTFGEMIDDYNPLPKHWTYEEEIEFDQRFQNTWEWGVNAGIGIEYRSGAHGFGADFQRVWALTSPFNEDTDIRNQSSQISASYLYYF
ncbi:MAG: outer membrane beta-barrel protein [Bacteroidales bacterium]|nr:outer membrane beta-barrel protein [Bacteroidales bacterium]